MCWLIPRGKQRCPDVEFLYSDRAVVSSLIRMVGRFRDRLIADFDFTKVSEDSRNGRLPGAT